MSNQVKFRFVVATRKRADQFWTDTATGRSLLPFRSPIVEVVVFPENSKGLPELYNEAIENSKDDPAILIFAHDDLHILDLHWMNTVFMGLQNFGVVGIVGNKSRVALQPGWAFIDEQFTWDTPSNLSGVVAHGKNFPPDNISYYGDPMKEVKLLDGLLIAAFSETLIRNHLKFDSQFKFHFYDLDFCRQAEVRGVTMGTIPLSLIHQSGGSFGSDAWKQGYKDYIQKWVN